MAIYSKKSKDPTEVALSAIQDALNIRDADVKLPPPSSAMPVAEAANEGRWRGGRAAKEAAESPAMMPGRDDRDLVQAANDDRESVGALLQSLQRRPSRTPFIIAALFAAL